jgi:hypothetical protein
MPCESGQATATWYVTVTSFGGTEYLFWIYHGGKRGLGEGVKTGEPVFEQEKEPAERMGSECRKREPREMNHAIHRGRLAWDEFQGRGSRVEGLRREVTGSTI